MFQLHIFFLCGIILRNFCVFYSFSLPDGVHDVKDARALFFQPLLTPTVPALRQPRQPRNKLPVTLKRPARSACAKGPGSGRGTRPAAHPPPQAGAELRTRSGRPRTRVAAAAELQQARPQPTARQPPAPAPPPQTCASVVFARVREMRPGGVRGPERGASGRPGRCGRAHRFGEPSVSADPAPSRFLPCLVLPWPEGSGALPLTAPAGAGARLREVARLGAERGCRSLGRAPGPSCPRAVGAHGLPPRPRPGPCARVSARACWRSLTAGGRARGRRRCSRPLSIGAVSSFVGLRRPRPHAEGVSLGGPRRPARKCFPQDAPAGHRGCPLCGCRCYGHAFGAEARRWPLRGFDKHELGLQMALSRCSLAVGVISRVPDSGAGPLLFPVEVPGVKRLSCSLSSHRLLV